MSEHIGSVIVLGCLAGALGLGLVVYIIVKILSDEQPPEGHYWGDWRLK